jgi:signal transduction histidine kinase
MAVGGWLRRRRGTLFDVLVAAGVAGLTGLGIFMRETPSNRMLLGYAMTVAILFRRRFPLSTMAAVGTFALLQVIAFPPTNDPLPFDLAVLVAMYSAVKYGRKMLDAYLAAAVVATGIVIEVVRHFGPNWFALTVFYVGVCGGVWLMAYTMRNRRLYVVTLEERAATLERERDHLARIAAADERAAIARELHDVVAHSLSVMIVQADGGTYAFDRDPDEARRALSVVAATGRDALEDMRRLVAVLRGADSSPAPPTSEEDDRRRITLDQLDSLVERARSAGLSLRFSVAGARPTLPDAVELTVYRIVQEALTNVLRHAGPRATVELCLEYRADAVHVSVVDDGLSPLAVAEPIRAGHGLVGMRERVTVHDGQFAAGPLPRGGWRVEATVPVPLPAPSPRIESSVPSMEFAAEPQP